jgi:hypothetical protein
MFMTVLSIPIHHKNQKSTGFATLATFNVCFPPACQLMGQNTSVVLSALLFQDNQNIQHEYELRNKSKFPQSKLTCMFCEASALGHISRAAVALSSFPVSPLTTTRLSRQAHATAVRWLPSLAASDSGPCDVARSSKRSNKGSGKALPSEKQSHHITTRTVQSHHITIRTIDTPYHHQNNRHTISPPEQQSHHIIIRTVQSHYITIRTVQSHQVQTPTLVIPKYKKF